MCVCVCVCVCVCPTPLLKAGCDKGSILSGINLIFIFLIKAKETSLPYYNIHSKWSCVDNKWIHAFRKGK